MEESGRAAIAKYVMRNRQNLGCLRVRDPAARRHRAPGEQVEAEKPKAAPDLMAALKASLEGVKGETDMSRLSKTELYARAKEADIPGRADMSEDELVEALSASS